MTGRKNQPAVKFTAKQRMFWPTATQALLRLSRSFFLIVGILAIGYVAFALLDARFYQAYETRRFQRVLETPSASGGTATRSDSLLLPLSGAETSDAKVETLAATRAGRSPLGRIEISSIGLAAMILEGVDAKTLRRAVGHIPGTAFPGQPGNVVLAGHRDTFFRALRNVRKDDEITLETLDGSFRYRVDLTQVVAPEDTEVLNGSDDSILTLVTCYPFSFVGPAPQRFIVRAHRIREMGTAPL
jgi:sortase A